MRWNVEGADGKTGQDRVVSIEADTREQAEREARRQGVLVSAVYESTALTALERADAEVDAALTEAAEHASPVMSYGSAQQRQIPEYRDIVSGAAMLKVIAAGLVFLGLLAVAGGVVGSVWASRTAGQDSRFLAVSLLVGGVLYGFPLLVGAVLVNMMASLAIAHRDIARNSFR